MTCIYLHLQNSCVHLKEKPAYEGKVLTSCFDLFLSSPVSYITQPENCIMVLILWKKNEP